MTWLNVYALQNYEQRCCSISSARALNLPSSLTTTRFGGFIGNQFEFDHRAENMHQAADALSGLWTTVPDDTILKQDTPVLEVIASCPQR